MMHVAKSVKSALSWILTRWGALQEKMEAFKAKFKGTEELGGSVTTGDRCTLPWLLATDLSADEAQLDKENWCGALQEVVVDTAQTAGAHTLPVVCRL